MTLLLVDSKLLPVVQKPLLARNQLLLLSQRLVFVLNGSPSYDAEMLLTG